MRHLIWQLISGHIAVTHNLTHRGMRCDNHCPRCGAPDETPNHAIFECPLALQTWALAPTPSPSGIFPSSGLFTNLDYLLWRISPTYTLASDRDPYPWIIWFIWKARNEKLFRGITRAPPDIVRHAEAECRAWHDANSGGLQTGIPMIPRRPIPSRLSNICLVDGSWHLEMINSGFGWVCLDADGTQGVMGARNQPKRLSPLHTELNALVWAMSRLSSQSTYQTFGTDCQEVLTMIEKPEDWPNFSTELKEFTRLRRCFPAFSLIHVPRVSNSSADHLARLARSQSKIVNFTGCSIHVWLATPPQV